MPKLPDERVQELHKASLAASARAREAWARLEAKKEPAKKQAEADAKKALDEARRVAEPVRKEYNHAAYETAGDRWEASKTVPKELDDRCMREFMKYRTLQDNLDRRRRGVEGDNLPPEKGGGSLEAQVPSDFPLSTARERMYRLIRVAKRAAAADPELALLDELLERNAGRLAARATPCSWPAKTRTCSPAPRPPRSR